MDKEKTRIKQLVIKSYSAVATNAASGFPSTSCCAPQANSLTLRETGRRLGTAVLLTLNGPGIRRDSESTEPLLGAPLECGGEWRTGHVGNLCAARARALAASSARFLGGAFVSSEFRRFLETAAISSTATRNAASLTFDGLWKPLTFLTNCSEAVRISSSVAGGLKLKSVLMFLHIALPRCVRVTQPVSLY
jgi:hypothetical protein